MTHPEPRDWVDWHAAYADPDSILTRRLAVVRARITAFLDGAPAGPLRAISMCAGQGHDLIGALQEHPRRSDVTARLVELDPRNVAAARAAAAAAGLAGVEVVEGDAALTDNYAGATPADLVLACGIFGNVADADVARTVAALPCLVAPGGTVVWTRHRGEPDLFPAIGEWFAAAGFAPVWLSDKQFERSGSAASHASGPGAFEGYGVGAHRFTGASRPLPRGERLFEFVHPPLPGP